MELREALKKHLKDLIEYHHEDFWESVIYGKEHNENGAIIRELDDLITGGMHAEQVYMDEQEAQDHLDSTDAYLNGQGNYK